MLNLVLRIFIFGLAVLLTNSIQAQIDFDAQYMARAEYRHGYQTLIGNGQQPAAFISQRARLISAYKSDKFKLHFSVQDVRTWGSSNHLTIDTSGSLSLHEGYGELYFNRNWTLKVGRQEIAYDEDRIFGSLDWAMQARRHDAALIKFKDSLSVIDFGFAFNQDRERGTSTVYNLPGHYKTFQYVYAKRKFDKVEISFLFLNNGMQHFKIVPGGNTITSTVFTQTFGPRAVYKNKDLTLAGNFYYQSGKDVAKKTVNAYEALIEASYKVNKKITLTTGAELLSGTSQTDTVNKSNKSFAPLYGTNHRFNGYMDYFYVGNHANSVGLTDVYLKAMYQANNYFISLNTHFFQSAASVRNKAITNSLVRMNSYLGTELDLTFNYKVANGASIQGGYSQLFGTKSMEALRGGNSSKTTNWAYVMVIIRPKMGDWPRTGLKM